MNTLISRLFGLRDIGEITRAAALTEKIAFWQDGTRMLCRKCGIAGGWHMTKAPIERKLIRIKGERWTCAECRETF